MDCRGVDDHHGHRDVGLDLTDMKRINSFFRWASEWKYPMYSGMCTMHTITLYKVIFGSEGPELHGVGATLSASGKTLKLAPHKAWGYQTRVSAASVHATPRAALRAAYADAVARATASQKETDRHNATADRLIDMLSAHSEKPLDGAQDPT